MLDHTLFPTSSLAPVRPKKHAAESNWTLWGQWIAIIAMVIDHTALLMFPDTITGEWFRMTIGRAAFPVFAAMLAWHALYNTRSLKRYMWRVLAIGAIAQIFFMQLPGFPSTGYLNVCFTLMLGLSLYGWGGGWFFRVKAAKTVSLASGAEFALIILAVTLASFFVEYGPLGVLFVPLLMFCYRRMENEHDHVGQRLTTALVLALTLLVAAGVNYSIDAMYFTVGTTITILLAITFLKPVSSPSIRIPRWVWLAWYPGHFAVLMALAGV